MTDPSAPYPLPQQTAAPRIGWRQLKRRHMRTLRWMWRGVPGHADQLEGIERLAEIDTDEIVVVTRQKNGMRFIRSFLRHYRSLGADRIVVIDEHSGDGIRDYVAAQPDSILLTARTSFAEADSGRGWFDSIFVALPKGQRIVYVDIDEYLVFGDGTRSLADLFGAMARRRVDRVATMMVDLYPAAPVRNAVFDGKDDRLPWQVAPFFDSEGYTVHDGLRGMRVTGGVRRRLFGEELYLTKYSVMVNPGRAVLDKSVHVPQPLSRNHGPVVGALLHFKYFSDFIEDHRRVVALGVYNKGGAAYKSVLEQLEGVDVANAFDFFGPSTTRYTGPDQLCELGLISDICNA